MEHQVDNCVDDPDWDPKYCRFEGAVEDCIPLPGCGKQIAHTFWFAFTCMVTFCLLNVFVAVILEAFEDSDAEEDAKLSAEQWEKFCLTWCEFVEKPITTVSAAFKMDMHELLPFFKNLDEPMGFRRDDGSMLASDKSLTMEIQDMDIQTVTIRGQPGLWA